MAKKAVLIDKIWSYGGKFLSCCLIFFSLFGGGILGFSVFGLTVSIYRLIVIVSFLFCFLKPKECIENIRGKRHFLSFFLIWIAISLFQLFYAKDSFSGIKDILIIGSAFVSSLFCSFFLKNRSFFTICLLIASAGVLFNEFLCLYEVFSGNYVRLGNSPISYLTSNKISFLHLWMPLGLFGNTNDFALFCFVSIFLSFLLFSVSSALWEKIYAICLSVISFFLILTTNSRAGVLSALLFFTIIFVFKLLPKYKVKALFRCATPVVVFLFALLFLMFYKVGNHAGSNVTRTFLLLDGIDILFRDTYGFGVGLGQIESYMYFYANTNGIQNIHFFLAEILVSSGVFFFSYFLLFWFSSLKKEFSLIFDSRGFFQNDMAAISFSFLLSFPIATLGPSSSMGMDFFWMSFFLVFVILANSLGEKTLLQNKGSRMYVD